MANIDPIFSKVGKVGSVTMTAANVKSDGDGTVGSTIFLAFQADATNGSYVQKLRFIATATAAATTTTPTTLRIFLSTIDTGATTSANTYLWAEVSVPAVVAAHSTNSTNYYEMPMGFALPPDNTILVTTHLAPAASTAWRAVVIGGDY